jgi:hypothetical protein
MLDTVCPVDEYVARLVWAEEFALELERLLLQLAQ